VASLGLVRVGRVKRTPLVRKTPLARGTSVLRRTALRAKPRPRDEWTDPAERAWVIQRDGCVAYHHDPKHECADTFGNPHGPYAFSKLTVDHVHDHAGGTKGVRAPCGGCAAGKPQRAFMTGMCARLNGGGGAPSRGLREFQRERLRMLEAQGRL